MADENTGNGDNGNGNSRMRQKLRTREAIVDACRQLIRSGAVVTMPEVAELALVSEPTAYRYFPDLISLLNEAIIGLWPTPTEALEPVAKSKDPSERIAFTAEVFLRRVLEYQGAVRAMIAVTITQPAVAIMRPGLRFPWIEYALIPWEGQLNAAHPGAFAQLNQDLAVIVSPETLFVLTDLCRLSPDDAVMSAVRLAQTVTAAAFAASA